MSTSGTNTVATTPQHEEGPSRWQRAFADIVSGNALISVLAVLAAMVVGGILIILTNEEVQTASGYFFARPGDTIAAAWNAVANAYAALFRGAVFNVNASTFTGGLRGITETLTFATPLIAGGLGSAIAFRAGLFNIGGTGQIIFGAFAAGWVGFTVNAPFPILLILAVFAGIIFGGLYAGLVGFLKARTGAHEVILTIMFNYVALYLASWLLKTPAFQQPGSNNPISPQISSAAAYPPLFGDQYRVHWGLVVVLAAVVFAWWLIERSAVGFRFRALGFNQTASEVAGINIGWTLVLVMAFSGAMFGLAGTAQILGTEKTLTGDIAASFGFDAITVALLGRSTPLGVLGAGLLMGALRAGGVTMQSAEGVPNEIVLIVQSVIVLFIAAPPLVRTIFRLPDPERTRKRQAKKKAAVQALSAKSEGGAS